MWALGWMVWDAARGGGDMWLLLALEITHHTISIHHAITYTHIKPHTSLHYPSLFMHYNEASHSSLVAEKTRTLDHPVQILSDDSALVHFEDKIKNKFVPSDSEFNLLDENSFFLNSDGIRTKLESTVEA
jgi:hypothetical protein